MQKKNKGLFDLNLTQNSVFISYFSFLIAQTLFSYFIFFISNFFRTSTNYCLGLVWFHFQPCTENFVPHTAFVQLFYKVNIFILLLPCQSVTWSISGWRTLFCFWLMVEELFAFHMDCYNFYKGSVNGSNFWLFMYNFLVFCFIFLFFYFFYFLFFIIFYSFLHFFYIIFIILCHFFNVRQLCRE